MPLCVTHALVIAAVVLTVHAPVLYGQAVFELHELAPGVHAAEVVRNPPVYAFANSLVVIGDDGVLVVDTQQSTAAARALIAGIARLTTAPVRWVVNTHWHGDHVNGNQAYADAFPGVEFIAHETVRSDLRTLGAARRKAELEELPASLAQQRKWLRQGAGPDGIALTPAQRTSVERTLTLREAYSSDLAGIVPTEPTLTVSDRLLLMVGDHEVVLIHVGPAHTRGDLLVHLPGPGILAVGDLLEAGLPYFADAYPAGWGRALEQIAALKPTVIVPSHGAVTRDGSLIDEARALVAAIIEYASGEAASKEQHGNQAQTWRQLEQRWEDRYGVSAQAFRATMQTAAARARLERETR